MRPAVGRGGPRQRSSLVVERRSHRSSHAARMAGVIAALVLVAGLLPAPVVAASAPPATPKAGDPVPGRLLVKYDRAATAATRTHVRAEAATTRARPVGHAVDLEVLDVPGDTAQTSRRLEALPGVKWVEADRYISADLTPDDPLFLSQGDLHDPGGHDIDAPEAWDITTGDAGTVVAVIDSGVDLDHPDLAPNLWTNPGETPGNGLDDDGNGFVDDVKGWDFWDDDEDPTDLYGHGTHVAGTIAAAGNNGIGVAGVAYSSRIMPLRVLGSQGIGSISDGVAAIDYAWRHGARVANLSWGYIGFPSQTLADAIATAGSNGMLVVAAAGNSGANLDISPAYPAAYDLPGLLTVGAVDRFDIRAGFSNIGRSTVDLDAPGVSIISTTFDGGYGPMSGTSMAAPHVAGVAALVFSQQPSWTPGQVRARILDTVRPVAGLVGETASGGIVNARDALAGAADHPPALNITSPSAGATVLPGSPVTFTATAVDPEDGNVGASISWSSSINGPLGTGATIGSSTLSVGDHVISAMATDAAGHRPIRSIRLTVGPTLRQIAPAPIDSHASIALAADGTPSIGFVRYGQGIVVATRGSVGSWTTTLASKSYLDSAVEGATDGAGQIAFAVAHEWTSTGVYSDPGIQLLRRSGATWTNERVTESCTDGQEGCGVDFGPTVAFASASPHVVFSRVATSNVPTGLLVPGVYHAHRTSKGGWATEVIARSADLPAGAALGGARIAVGTDGALHAVWSLSTGGSPQVWYATNQSGSWVSTLLTTNPSGWQPHVAVTPSNQVIVALPTLSGLWLRTRTGPNWDTWKSAASGSFTDADLAIDGAGAVHLAVGRVDADGVAAGVAYVTNKSGTWKTTDVAIGQASAPSIAVTAAGIGHIAFSAAWPSPGISYSTNGTGAWVTTVVAPNSGVDSVAYAVDGRGVPHVAVARDGVGAGIYYGTGAGSWALTRLTSLPPNGGVAMAVDTFGVAHLLYGTFADAAGKPLADPAVYYATNASGVWRATRLGPNPGYSGRSLVLDAAGRVHAAFAGRIGTTEGIVYATNPTGSWQQRLLTTTNQDADPSLAIDTAGRIHMAATRATGATRGIIYATNSSGSWSLVNRTAGFQDFFPSLAVGPDNRPAIAFWRNGGGVLIHDLTATGWKARAVIVEPEPGPASLVIDGAGQRTLLVGAGSYDYSHCGFPNCPNYPGLRVATGLATGPITTTLLTGQGEDSRGTLARGLDGSLRGAFIRTGSGAFEITFARSTRGATATTDLSPAGGVAGATVTLSGKVTSNGTSLADRAVVFRMDGVTIGQGTTNAQGVATFAWKVAGKAGARSLTIGFAGSTTLLASVAGPRPFAIRAPVAVGIGVMPR